MGDEPNAFEDLQDAVGMIKSKIDGWAGAGQARLQSHEDMLKKNCEDIDKISRTVLEIILQMGLDVPDKQKLEETMGPKIIQRLKTSGQSDSGHQHCTDQLIKPSTADLLGVRAARAVRGARGVVTSAKELGRTGASMLASKSKPESNELDDEMRETIISQQDYRYQKPTSTDIRNFVYGLNDKSVIDNLISNDYPVPGIKKTTGKRYRKYMVDLRQELYAVLMRKTADAAMLAHAASEVPSESEPAAGTTPRTSLPRASKRGSHTEAPNISAFELWEKYSPMDKENFKMMMIENPKIFSPGVEEEADREPWAEAETGEIFDKHAPLSTELTKTEFKGALADLRLGGGGIINTKIRNKVKRTKIKSKVKRTKRKSKVKMTKRK
jgi:hypothetical protein